MSTTLPGQISVITGETWFYGSYKPLLGCSHSPFCIVWGFNSNEPTGCGLCHLQAIFETEFPKRLHEYELLAENGNPETTPAFWSRIESAMGLEGPKPHQDLRKYRASRAMQYRQPSRGQFPVTSALWKMMGYQPKLAKPLVRSLLGVAPEAIGREFSLSVYRVHETLGKGVRFALRELRN
jgi:hypothetical protein